MEIAIIPRFIIARLFTCEASRIHANVMITSVLIIALTMLYHRLSGLLSTIPHVCLFQVILGIPCPGCGVTRSICAILESNASLAWKANPAGLLLSFYLLAQIPMRIIAIALPAYGIRISNLSKLGSKIVIFVLLLTWIIKAVQ